MGISFLAALSAVSVACGESRSAAPTAPSPRQATLTGSWQGIVSTPLTGFGRLMMTIDELPVDTTRSALVGKWRVSFDRGGDATQGTISGVLSSSTAEITLVPVPRPECPSGTLFSSFSGSFLLRVETSQALMKGTANYVTCTEGSDGTVELARE